MINGDKNIDSNISNEEENLNIDQISKTKNNIESKEQFFNDFDSDLNLSNIINNDNNEIKIEKNIKNQIPIGNGILDKSLDLENLDKINITNGEIFESSIQSINIDLNNENKKGKKIRTKEDLNNTPLPVFECLYCAKEKIVFQHLINEIISDKYLLKV